MINKIHKYFPCKKELNVVDNFKNYEYKFISDVNTSFLSSFTKESYSLINDEIVKFDYDWNLEIEEINFVISQNVFKEIDIDDLEDFDELTIIFTIYKKGKHVLIIDENCFFTHIENEGIENILKLFNSEFKNGIIFNNDKDIKASNNFIGYNLDLQNNITENNIISSQCNFNNSSEIKLNPNLFVFDNYPNDDKVLNFIGKIHQLFILIYLFDTSVIQKNNIQLKISGYKTLVYDLNFNNLKLDSLDWYSKIFEWVYSEKNKIEDKIGIVRNILSIYLNENDFSITNNTYNSILSANKTYIKGNISKYLEVRNKVHEQIESVSKKVNSSLESFFSNFQKSIFVFISFYLSVFVLKVYTKTNLEEMINREATIMAIGLLILSFLFMLFSNWILNLEKGRITKKYEDTKKRALDLLVKDDVNIILDNDNEYNEELEFLDKRKKLYNCLWILTLIVFVIILFTTSNYINFRYIDY